MNLQGNSAIPPETFPLTKAQFCIVKCFHHLHQLERSEPLGVRRQRDRLRTFLRPAFSNDEFRKSAAHLADTWASESTKLLRQHYENELNEAKRKLVSSSFPDELFERSISLVRGWARNQLGRRLNDDTLRRATECMRNLHRRQPTASPLLHAPTEPTAEDFTSLIDTQASISCITDPTPPDPDKDTCTWIPVCSPEANQLSPTSECSYQREDHTVPAIIHHGPQTPSVPKAIPTPIDHDLLRMPQRSNLVLFRDPIIDASSSALTTFISPAKSTQQPQSHPNVSASNSEPPSSVLKRPSVLLAAGCIVENFRGYVKCVPASQGRLSQLRAAVASLSENPDIRHVFILPSLCDFNNKLDTLCSDFKSLLGRCHRLFPSAELFAIFPPLPENISSSQRVTLKEFLYFAKQKHPSGAKIVRSSLAFSTLSPTILEQMALNEDV